jgi:hypothetical protein
MKRYCALWVLICCGVPVAMAQRGFADTGTVIGHVYLADTGGPARLAEVALQPVEVMSRDRSYEERRKDGGFRLYVTGLDGAYRMNHVRPGMYYVVVKQPGYLSPFALFTNAQLVHPTAQDQEKIAQYLPVVTVAANNVATMDVHLTRGASLSGTIRFDDGSPDSRTRVSVLEKDEKGQWKELGLVHGGDVDDEGHYRVTGLLEGDYLLRVGMEIEDLYVDSVLDRPSSISGRGHYDLEFYSGDTAREKDAKTIHLDSSQEMSSADVTIPVSKLHVVSGAIVEAKGGRAINSGTVTLSYADGGEEIASVKVESDEPVFRLPFVPEGVYVIRVKDAAEVTRQEISNGAGSMPPTHTQETVVRRYGTMEQPLTVVSGDVTGLNLGVTVVAKTP